MLRTTWKLWIVVIFFQRTIKISPKLFWLCPLRGLPWVVYGAAALSLSLTLALNLILHKILAIKWLLIFWFRHWWWRSVCLLINLWVLVVFRYGVLMIFGSIYVNGFFEFICTNTKLTHEVSTNEIAEDKVGVILTFCCISAVTLNILMRLLCMNISNFEALLYS